ncbi:ankyrin repeat domain-containing protein [Granulosicoccus antarcticus]|uniref:Ankyrin repeat protein n=1 Tax=Granulosicoccus antarcticus IMCC3135 TaxID=1192854 RepID=A0A2Z2NUW8_9GAMM|nr:ankyrin repeat domain-containing protein [Granulosicoccus antarcticus]ASJ74305.1 hypothetical protein IMCC3135_21140 [Granulosicoccus antarcticus IMCC3135]
MKYIEFVAEAFLRSIVFWQRKKNGSELLLLALALSFLNFYSSVIFSRELPHHEVTADAEDYALRDTVLSGSLEDFDRHLSLGASPVEWLDDSQEGWVLCAVTAEGREQFLRLLIDKEYDVNYHQIDISSSISLPLACALRFENTKALGILLDAGADPTIAPSIKFPDSAPRSVMSLAIMIGRYDLALLLFDKGNYTGDQLKSDISMLERFPVDESAPGNVYRLKLADKFRERGFQITPWTRGETTEK